MSAGRLVAVVGPSGAGKDTLMAAACVLRPDLRIARRVITRPADAGGEEHEAVSEEDFARRQAAGDFVLSWQAHGLSYAIPRAVGAELARGHVVLFNGSRGMLAQARAAFPALEVILVTARPGILAARLAGRGREDAADIAARLQRAEYALPDGIAARVVVNEGSVAEGARALLAALDAAQPARG